MDDLTHMTPILQRNIYTITVLYVDAEFNKVVAEVHRDREEALMRFDRFCATTKNLRVELAQITEQGLSILKARNP